MSRLIGADELKTAFPPGEYVRTECVRATIDAAPTVQAISVEWLREKIKEHTDEEGWQDYLANSFGLCLEKWQNEQEANGA